MKKVLFFIPAIVFAFFAIFFAFAQGLSVSPMVFGWIAVFACAGILLSKNYWLGGIIGMIPAIWLMYMGTVDTGQVINETPIGVVILIYYAVCTIVAIKTKHQ